MAPIAIPRACADWPFRSLLLPDAPRLGAQFSDFPRWSMVSYRLATCGGGVLMAAGLLLGLAQAGFPLSQECKDKLKQFLCPNQHWLPHTQRACNKHGIPNANYEVAESRPSA